MKRASARVQKRGGRWWLVVAGIEFLSFDTWREAYDYAYTHAATPAPGWGRRGRRSGLNTYRADIARLTAMHEETP